MPREDAEFLSTPCDVLVLAALGGAVNSTTAPLLQCAAVIEGANHAITPTADRILQHKGA